MTIVSSLAFDPDGNVHVVDKGNFRVLVYTKTGTFVESYGTYGNDAGQCL